MRVEKFSVSFDKRTAEAVRRGAKLDGESVSAWLADAAATKTRNRSLREALDAFAAEHGALSDSDIDSLIRDARRTSRLSGITSKAVRSNKARGRRAA